MTAYITSFKSIRNNIDKYKEKHLVPIGTCCSVPPWYVGDNCTLLAPLKIPHHCGSCSEHIGGDCKFLTDYYAYLNSLDFDKLQKALKMSARASDSFGKPLLVVWEETNNPCSERWPLERWYKEHGVILESV